MSIGRGGEAPGVPTTDDEVQALVELVEAVHLLIMVHAETEDAAVVFGTPITAQHKEEALVNLADAYARYVAALGAVGPPA